MTGGIFFVPDGAWDELFCTRKKNANKDSNPVFGFLLCLSVSVSVCLCLSLSLSPAPDGCETQKPVGRRVRRALG